MKTKTFNKRLSLSKETVVNLGQTEIKEIKGGAVYETWEQTYCIVCTANTCIRCPSAACTNYTCDCPTGTCATCWPEMCV